MPKRVTIGQLRKQLVAQERKLGKLVARRKQLLGQIADIDAEIALLSGGAPRGGGRGRRGATPSARTALTGWGRRLPKNTKPLIEYAKDVLAGAPNGMRVKEVEAAIRKAGYQTFSQDFYGIVATTLREGPFDKVGRGVYKLKTVPKPAAKKASKRKKATKKASKKAPKRRKVAGKKPAEGEK